MCRVVAGLALVLKAATVTTLSAQSTADLRERARRFMAIEAAAEAIEGRARRVDSASFAPTDSLRADGLRLRFASRHRQLVDSAVRVVYQDMPPDLRAPVNAALRDVVFIFYRPGDRVVFADSAAARASAEFVALDTLTKANILGEALRSRMSAYLSRRLDSRGRLWIGQWLPVRTIDREGKQVVYASMAVSRSRLARDCVTNQVNACAKALRIVPVGDTVLEWYSAADRREIITSLLQSPLITEARTGDVEGCLRGDDTPCERAMRAIGTSGWPAPTHESALESFMEHVLRVGGDSSLQRFLADSSLGMLARLEHAGGRPLEKMIGEWRQDLLEARPRAGFPDPYQRWLALVGVLTFGVAALVRRSWI